MQVIMSDKYPEGREFEGTQQNLLSYISIDENGKMPAIAALPKLQILKTFKAEITYMMPNAPSNFPASTTVSYEEKKKFQFLA